MYNEGNGFIRGYAGQETRDVTAVKMADSGAFVKSIVVTCRKKYGLTA